MQDKFKENILEEIKKEHWSEVGSVYDLGDYQSNKLEIHPDPSVARALFVPSKIYPGHYLAHPSTIRAMKREIFVAGHDFLNSTLQGTCKNCHLTLDLQFWNLCPFCEAEISKN